MKAQHASSPYGPEGSEQASSFPGLPVRHLDPRPQSFRTPRGLPRLRHVALWIAPPTSLLLTEKSRATGIPEVRGVGTDSLGKGDSSSPLPQPCGFWAPLGFERHLGTPLAFSVQDRRQTYRTRSAIALGLFPLEGLCPPTSDHWTCSGGFHFNTKTAEFSAWPC